MAISLRSVCILLTGTLMSASAGPFTVSGVSTVETVDLVYKKSVRVSGEQVTKASVATSQQTDATSEPTNETTDNTKEAIIEPLIRSSTMATDAGVNGAAKVSRVTSEGTAPATDAVMEVSHQTANATDDSTAKSADATAPVTAASQNLAYQSMEATAGASVRATELTEPMTDRSMAASADVSAATGRASSKVSDSTAPLMDATGRTGTESAAYSSEATAHSSDASTKVTGEASKVSDVTLAPTLDATTVATEVSSDVSDVTPKALQASIGLVDKVSGRTGRSTLEVSKSLDQSLADTTAKTWKKHEAARMDPDIADQLLKDAYAFRGTTLTRFAHELRVSERRLALVLIQDVPGQPTRNQLERMMTWVIPALEREQASS